MKFYIFIMFLFAGLASCHAQGAPVEVKSQQASYLQMKADTAFAYCKKNKLDTTLCILIDMKIHSGKNRFFVWNFKEKKAIRTSLCCHGCGGGSTGETPVFSNRPGSYCTSLGKYKIGTSAYSQYGINVHYKLHGLEKSNSNAFDRIVVLHSHTPVPEGEIHPHHLPMGWSLGCPVVSNDMMKYLGTCLKSSRMPVLLWIYY